MIERVLISFAIYIIVSTIITGIHLYRSAFFLNFGQKCIEWKKYKWAIKGYKIALKRKPNNKVLRFKIGVANFLDGEYKIAQHIFEEILVEDPESYEAHYNLGLINVIWENYDYAKAFFDKALELVPDDQDTLYQKGLLEFQVQNFQEALDCFNRLDDKDNINYKYCILRCIDNLSTYMDDSENMNIVVQYREMLSNKNLDPHYNIDEAYVTAIGKSGKLHEMMSLCDKYIQKRKCLHYMYKLQGVGYLLMQDFQKAMVSLSNAQQCDPDDYETYQIISKLYKLKDVKDKVRKFEQVARLLQEHKIIYTKI